MVDMFGLEISLQVFFNIMVSLSFFVGLILLVSPTAFKEFDKALQKEYGSKIKLVPHLENTYIDAIDRFILSNRVAAGAVIVVAAFIMLLFFR